MKRSKKTVGWHNLAVAAVMGGTIALTAVTVLASKPSIESSVTGVVERASAMGLADDIVDGSISSIEPSIRAGLLSGRTGVHGLSAEPAARAHRKIAPAMLIAADPSEEPAPDNNAM